MKIKTTKSYCFPSTRMVPIQKKKKKTITGVGKDLRKSEPSEVARRNVNGAGAVEDSLAVPGTVNPGVVL